MKWEYWVTMIEADHFAEGLTAAGLAEWQLVRCEFSPGYNLPISGATKPDEYKCVFMRPAPLSIKEAAQGIIDTARMQGLNIESLEPPFVVTS